MDHPPPIRKADGRAVSRSTMWFPAERFAGIDKAFSETGSITRAFSMCGVDDYLREVTEISAVHAEPDDVAHLELTPGAIVLAAVVWSLKPLAAGAAGLIWAACALASTLVLAGALARIAITDDLAGARRLGLGPVGLQFGSPEVRLLGAGLLCAIFLAMILSVVALVLLAVFGMAELNPGNGKQLRGLGQGKIDGHGTGELLRV